MKKICILLLFTTLLLSACGTGVNSSTISQITEETKMARYYFTKEDNKHEGTWLNWPHQYTYGLEYRNKIEEIWLEMAYALHSGEKVHIIAYDEAEKSRISALLMEEDFDMDRIDFVIAKSDDVWSRDTGPMFVFEENGDLAIADFGFDGWGEKTPYKNDDAIPIAVSNVTGIKRLDISDFVLEGGSVELDGAGTLMACKSSVVSKNRNSEITISQAEGYLEKYLGATNFIWLEGVTDEDITDAHIDGMAKFYDDKTLLTVSEEDFFQMYEGIVESDYERIINAKNAKGEPYEIVTLPMTAKNVDGLDYKGSYINYYVANDVVLLPVYNDENDDLAVDILTELYEEKKIIPINVTALYQYGGMIHCVTQQQPVKE